MKVEDAIFNVEKIIAYTEKIFKLKDEHKEALKIALEAMEKQIPSGIRFNGDEAVCPKCGADAEWKKYCEECGQRLVSDDEG